jgi:hypothetical protein
MPHISPNSESDKLIIQNIQELTRLRDSVTNQINQQINQLADTHDLEFVVTLQKRQNSEQDIYENGHDNVTTPTRRKESERNWIDFDKHYQDLKNNFSSADLRLQKPEMDSLTQQGYEVMGKLVQLLEFDIDKTLREKEWELKKDEAKQGDIYLFQNSSLWGEIRPIVTYYTNEFNTKYVSDSTTHINEHDGTFFEGLANDVAEYIFITYRESLE